ncbi:MAG: hypothetical protein CMN77_11820 [Spirochaetaceae bacterium]|nr:hypothetical protein [Spirochaetaceae bacterium]
MSFQEKNAWACLLAILAAYIPYFSFSLREPIPSVVPVVPLVTAVVFLVILQIVFHALNTIFSKQMGGVGQQPKPDEREQYIDLKASKIAGFVLAIWVVVWCINAMLLLPFVEVATPATNASLASTGNSLASISGTVALWWVNLLFAGFVFTNAVHYATLIFFYRR